MRKGTSYEVLAVLNNINVSCLTQFRCARGGVEGKVCGQDDL